MLHSWSDRLNQRTVSLAMLDTTQRHTHTRPSDPRTIPQLASAELDTL